MSEIGDTFKAYREEERRQRDENTEYLLTELKRLKIPHRVPTEGQIMVTRFHLKIMYYPRNEWWKHLETGDRHDGDPKQFIEWLKQELQIEEEKE